MLHKWTKSTGLPLTFQIRKSVDDSKPYDNFQGIGDNRIHSEYKAGKGSVIIELKPTFLETL